MSGAEMIISVIIPTHNREEALLQALKSLSVQSFSKLQFEVIVVADGCTKNTIEVIRSFKAPYKLQIFEQEASGAAAARNRGAAHAIGSVLLFLDDDITASPQLVESHVKAHQRAENQVVIGYLSTVLKNQKGFFGRKLIMWWEEIFDAMKHKSHLFSYRNLLSGNFSLSAQLFNSVGGFDASFKCQEDYELGVRLIEADAQFAFEPEAMGYHNEITDLNRWLNRKYSEGKAAVQLYQKYPHLIDSIPVIKEFVDGIPPFYQRALQFIYKRKLLAEREAFIYNYALRVAEWLHMFQLWEKLLGRQQTYWYLRGMVDSVNDLNILMNISKRTASIQNKFPSIKEKDFGGESKTFTH